jgi:antitoxin (DNA-binding transcriptional repressor) of toxin-antitoxin stability system
MMTLVTLDEARDRLPELVRLMAAGEKVVFTDGGKWVAALAAPPPMPLTPEEETDRQARAKEAIREMVQARIDEGYPPESASPLWQFFDEGAEPK